MYGSEETELRGEGWLNNPKNNTIHTRKNKDVIFGVIYIFYVSLFVINLDLLNLNVTKIVFKHK